MTSNKCVMATVAAALAVAGCSNVLGLKDPTLEAMGDDAPKDAAIDAVPIDAPIDTPPGCPAKCDFGCDAGTTTCRDGKLWLFATMGTFQANGFGGTDRPSTVRATADLRCVQTYMNSNKFMMRQCNRARTHAVLYVSDGDSLGLMATQYNIPVTVPVHRADDDAAVFSNWDDLVDTTGKRPAVNPITDSTGLLWTGALGTATCNSWTTLTGEGVVGNGLVLAANWLSREGGLACDTLARLLCICWSGGE